MRFLHPSLAPEKTKWRQNKFLVLVFWALVYHSVQAGLQFGILLPQTPECHLHLPAIGLMRSAMSHSSWPHLGELRFCVLSPLVTRVSPTHAVSPQLQSSEEQMGIALLTFIHADSCPCFASRLHSFNPYSPRMARSKHLYNAQGFHRGGNWGLARQIGTLPQQAQRQRESWLSVTNPSSPGENKSKTREIDQWLSLLLKITWILFPVPTWGSSQLPATPTPGIWHLWPLWKASSPSPTHTWAHNLK